MKTVLLLIVHAVCLISYSQTSVHLDNFSEDVTEFTTMEVAEKVYNYFDSLELFLWDEDENNCEDRANATCMLLEEWKIPSQKAWIFSSKYLKRDKKEGRLMCVRGVCWGYHVAAIIPVKENGSIKYVVIDPSTTDSAKTLEEWAEIVTRIPKSYYFITKGEKYIFNGKRRKRISNKTFSERNQYNDQYTIEGLAGYNGKNRKHRRIMRSDEGEEHLRKTKEAFEALKLNNPFDN